MGIKRVILATTNEGKIAELTKLFAAHGIEAAGAADFIQMDSIEETGATFAENALIKARAVAQAAGAVAIADDSGIVVDALGGEPGVRSARYGDDWKALPGESRDARNIRKLLHAMRKVPKEDRACHFEAAVAAASPSGHELVARGRWNGRLLIAPLGSRGFGYDPLFWDPETGKSAAQMRSEQKNLISHRARALAALLEQWEEYSRRVQG